VQFPVEKQEPTPEKTSAVKTTNNPANKNNAPTGNKPSLPANYHSWILGDDDNWIIS
jgi:hypothetical protein